MMKWLLTNYQVLNKQMLFFSGLLAKKIMCSTEQRITSLYLKGDMSPYHHIKYCYNFVANEETDEAEQAPLIIFTIF